MLLASDGGAKGDRKVHRGWAEFPWQLTLSGGGDVVHFYVGTDGLSWDGVFLTHGLANPANHSHGSRIVPCRYYGNSTSRCVLHLCVCEKEREEMMYGAGVEGESRRCESLGRHPHHSAPPLHPHGPGLKIPARSHFRYTTISVCVAVMKSHWSKRSSTVVRHEKALLPQVVKTFAHNKVFFFFVMCNNRIE